MQNTAPSGKLRAARRAQPSPSVSGQPMSRQELADACNQAMAPGRWIGMTASYIGALERGEIRWPNAAYRNALCAVLGASPRDLGFYVDRPERRTAATHSQSHAVDHPDDVGATNDGATIRSAQQVVAQSRSSHDNLNHGRAGDHTFLAVTRLLASQRQSVAPAALLSLVEAHRDSLAVLFERAGSSPVRMDIGLMLGETSIVASRLWSAVGKRGLAIAHCAYARQLAEQLVDPVLGATARIFESNLRSEAATLIGSDGDLAVGLRLLDEAAAIDRGLPPSARARIAAEQAQTYAVLGLKAETVDALGQARRAVDDIDGPEPGLFSDWTQPRLQVYEGTCWLFLGNADRSVRTLTQAVHQMETDPSNVNVLLAARVDLASAYAESGELEHGCALLGDTYTALMNLENRRGIQRAIGARRRLDRWKDERAVRELDDVLQAT